MRRGACHDRRGRARRGVGAGRAAWDEERAAIEALSRRRRGGLRAAVLSRCEKPARALAALRDPAAAPATIIRGGLRAWGLGPRVLRGRHALAAAAKLFSGCLLLQSVPVNS